MTKSHLTSALYLDFDNVHSSLAEMDRDAAHAFATRPGDWLAWLESAAHVAADAPVQPRRMLVRRCYASPHRISAFRHAFVCAGFTVIDCPPLTTQGKNCADIRMVVDMLDAIGHPTRFDEFVIMSSDSDFTPVLSRLREHDRRTAIFASKNTATPLKAACDCTITDAAFRQDALGCGRHDELCATVSATIAAAMAEMPNGAMLISALGQRLCKTMGQELQRSRYCGHGSLKTLLSGGNVLGDHVLGTWHGQCAVIDPNRHEPDADVKPVSEAA